MRLRVLKLFLKSDIFQFSKNLITFFTRFPAAGQALRFHDVIASVAYGALANENVARERKSYLSRRIFSGSTLRFIVLSAVVVAVHRAVTHARLCSLCTEHGCGEGVGEEAVQSRHIDINATV